ncbi:MAG TPA: carboxypeptidase-like regulatory domain-containing protein [Verrucomicrobiae bacterium]|nr:carboxypeptidase-like regulatory domain-containing protein [Verrucomicrobiae bacterium]
MSLRESVCAGIFLAFLLIPTGILAQQGTTSLHGVVTDPQSAVIVGAHVLVEDAERGLQRETTTNASGFYEIAQLPPGVYRLLLSLPRLHEIDVRTIYRKAWLSAESDKLTDE